MYSQYFVPFQNELLMALTPIMDEVKERKTANQTTPLDARITALFDQVYDARNANSSSTVNGYKLINTHISGRLTLSDFKAAMEHSDALSKHIIDHLDLQPNLDRISQQCAFEKRIKAVSDCVLKSVSLRSLQETELCIKFIHSPAWYALATEEEFLNRKVSEMVDFCSDTEVAATKIRNIEENTPELLKNWFSIPFTPPGNNEELDLTIRKLRTLSGEELTVIASKLPPSACRILSDSQIQTIDFACFSGQQLDVMIDGEGTKEDVLRRLDLLSPVQKKIFEKKTSGKHFDQYPDAFFATVSLDAFTEEQIFWMFDTQNDILRRRLQLVRPEEVAKALDLLQLEVLEFLSSQQIAALDYTKISQKQIEAICLYVCEDDKREQKVSSIPIDAVNDAARRENKIIPYLSLLQIPKIDPELLHLDSIQALFPGFTAPNLHPGYAYIGLQTKDGKVYYTFSNGFDEYRHSKKKLHAMIEERKNRCKALAKVMTPQQLLRVKHMAYPEVCEFLEEFYPIMKGSLIDDACD